jgi:hypothetical protein
VFGVSPYINSDTHLTAVYPDDMHFVAYLRSQKLLKGILCGHGHYGVVDQFSPTAKQYMVGANFFFHGNEFTIR